MDVKRESQAKLFHKKYVYFVASLIALVSLYFLKDVLGDASFIVDKNELMTAKVQKGSFQINVRGTGALKPTNIRWVSSQVLGRVEQVLIKPGSQVKAGEVLMLLSNPELKRELERSRWELKALTAENNASYLSLESQLVDLKNTIIAAEYSYQSSKLKLDAETQLFEQKNATVSALDYQRSQLTVKQQKQYWQSQQQKAEKMKANLSATKSAQDARLAVVENNFQRIADQVAALEVKATTGGVVQKVSLELGEQVMVGGSVALIADQRNLYAELEVQELRISDINLGQSVEIDTRSNKISGKVIRIAPTVNAGMVLIDVELTSTLPKEARPDLTVDGLIQVSNIENALYVKRPAFAPRNSKTSLYKVSSDQQFATKLSVSLGQSSVSQIQVISGLSDGDTVIISDTSRWQDHKEIMLN